LYKGRSFRFKKSNEDAPVNATKSRRPKLAVNTPFVPGFDAVPAAVRPATVTEAPSVDSGAPLSPKPNRKPKPEPIVLPAELQTVESAILERKKKIEGFGRKAVQLYLEQGADFVGFAEALKPLGVWVRWQKEKGFNPDSVHRLIRLHDSAVNEAGSFEAARRLCGKFGSLAEACRHFKIRMGDPARQLSVIETVTNSLSRAANYFGCLSADEKKVIRSKLAEMMIALER